MNLQEAIETLKDHSAWLKMYAKGHEFKLKYAIDTVVAELEPMNHKELTCDHNWKEWEDENCNAQMRCTKCKSIRKWYE